MHPVTHLRRRNLHAPHGPPPPAPPLPPLGPPDEPLPPPALAPRTAEELMAPGLVTLALDQAGRILAIAIQQAPSDVCRFYIPLVEGGLRMYL